MTKVRSVMVAVIVVVTGVLASGPPLAAAPPRPRPTLIVLLVVDQMRADYVERYGHQWSAGLRRLLDEGASFRLAAYPYQNTVTCPGHATISTGTVPRSHGIPLNEWWDRRDGRLVACTEDARSPLVSYGRAVSGGESAWALRVPTLADELRAQLPIAPRVVTVSLKARTAVMMAGRRADASTWFDDEGAWVTSVAFAAAPVPFVQRVVDANPMTRELEAVWTPSLPPDAYLFDDDGSGERPPPGWTARFPHKLAPPEPLAAEGARYERWDRSPYADDYLGRFAEAALDELKLGQGPGLDFLAVSFSALDRVGHRFGPHSHEVQDTLVRLDRTIGALLHHLDRSVGRGRYVLALSSDHGVAPIAEQTRDHGLAAGRVSTAKTAEAVNTTLERFLGPGKHIARMVYTDLYFAAGVYEQLLSKPDAMQAAIQTLETSEGVWKAYRKEDLTNGAETGDPTRRAAALSYVQNRSGDLVIVPQPYYSLSSDATTHGTAYQYDARVPIVLAGFGIRPGEYLTPATPADIAPTLAFLSGIEMSAAEGRVLTEALAAPPPAKPRVPATPRR